ncbi:MAG: hypothetical protein H6742_17205 [Alphaproteobacteria bacterium]|nr:hypothetical protein [Alphaproteobacteria bacterium]
MTRSPRILATTLAAVLGVALTAGAFVVVRGFVTQEAELRAQQIFQRDFAHHLVLLDESIDQVLGRARAVASLYAASEQVTQDELARFTQGLEVQPAVRAYGTCVVESSGCRLVDHVLADGQARFPG